ncbi:MAG: PAS domain S-box protein [bacterium]
MNTIKQKQKKNDFVRSLVSSIENKAYTEEQLYRQSVLSMKDGFIILDRQGKVVLKNPSASTILGYDLDQSVSRDLLPSGVTLVGEDGKSLVPIPYYFKKVLRSKVSVENVVLGIQSDSIIRQWISASLYPIFSKDKKNIEYVVATFHDVTEEKHLEETLEKLNTLLLNLGDDLHNDLQSLLTEALEVVGADFGLYGRAHGEQLEVVNSVNLPPSFPLISGQKSLKYTQRLLKKQKGKPLLVADLNMPKGSFFEKFGIVSFIGYPIISQGKLSGILALYFKKIVSVDRNAIKLVELIANAIAVQDERGKVSLKNKQLVHAIEQSPVSVVITDIEGVIQYVNPKFTAVTGYSREEAMGNTSRVLKSGVQPFSLYKNLWQTITSGNEWRGELCNKKKNGSLYWEFASISAVKNAEGKITNYIAVKEDISKRKELEEGLRRKDRLTEIVSHAAEQFLSVQGGESIAMILQGTIKKLGQEMQVSRVYVFENSTDEKGAVLMQQTFEWVAKGIAPQLSEQKLQKLPYNSKAAAGLQDAFTKREMFLGHVRNFPPAERKILAEQGIVSLLLVPIYAGDLWWGFMGFDECTKEREWSMSERDTLQLAANIIGGSIARQQAEDAIRKRTEELERLNKLMLGRELKMIELKQQIASQRQISENKEILHA